MNPVRAQKPVTMTGAAPCDHSCFNLSRWGGCPDVTALTILGGVWHDAILPQHRGRQRPWRRLPLCGMQGLSARNA